MHMVQRFLCSPFMRNRVVWTANCAKVPHLVHIYGTMGQNENDSGGSSHADPTFHDGKFKEKYGKLGEVRIMLLPHK